MVDAAYYLDLLRPLFKGRRVILAGMVLAGATPLVDMLRRLGADRCLVVATGLGTGPLPSPESTDWVFFPPYTSDVVTELREIGRHMAAPPAEVVAAIDRFDPDRRAIVVPPIITLGPVPDQMAGRPVWGRRPEASLPLEDKTTVDALWDRLGVRHAPSETVACSIDAMIGAHQRLNRGAGTVFSGDGREGPHGGAHLVRWVRGDDDLIHAMALYTEHCDRVRVVPFVEGIPCSVHGLVFDDAAVALRPVELIVLRPAEGSRFLYAGAATFWDPPQNDRDHMREVARTLAAVYREQVGTGCFTIDGILSHDGWLPTELNPRFGAGLNVIARGLPDLPLTLLCQALQGGERLDYRPADLERYLLQAADNHRHGGGWTTIPHRQVETRTHSLVREGAAFRLARPMEPPDGSLMIGPSVAGGFIRFTAEPARTVTGRSIAPEVVAAFALADREFGTGLGRLAAAQDVRQ